MSYKQYHFVVMYDEHSDTFELDYETQEAKFNNLSVYDSDTGEWEPLEPEHWEDNDTAYNRAGDALASALRRLQALPIKED
jgi:hypothetical protein